MTSFVATLGRLLTLRRPRVTPPILGPGHAIFAIALCFGEAVLSSWSAVDPPRVFTSEGFKGTALFVLAALGLAYGMVKALRRPVLFWSLGAYAIAIFALVNIAADLTWWALSQLLHRPGGDVLWLILGVMALWHFLALGTWFAWYGRAQGRWLRFSAALFFTLALIALPMTGFNGDYFQTAYDEDAYDDYSVDYDAELLMNNQFPRVDEALAKLEPQTPGQVDLYVVTFGGDGAEDVFKNETFHAARLFAERFGAQGRVLSLINNPDTVDGYPLATRSNLDRALRGLGAIIDPDEDIVLIALSSHGSRGHEIYVSLDYLPLNQLASADLAQSIHDAGIRYRGFIISACYAGGFIPGLKNDTAAVLAAARADRTSFGCGADSNITYFGRALYAEALNETGDLEDAFNRAKLAIARREQAEKLIASEPQAAIGAGFARQWAAYLKTHALGAPVPFEDAPPRNVAAKKTEID